MQLRAGLLKADSALINLTSVLFTQNLKQPLGEGLF